MEIGSKLTLRWSKNIKTQKIMYLSKGDVISRLPSAERLGHKHTTLQQDIVKNIFDYEYLIQFCH